MEEPRGWSGFHIDFQFNQASDMKDWILLDNGSTVDIFCNPNLVTNIRTSNETLELRTNGGILFTNQVATVPHYGDVWFDPSALANILSLSKLASKHCITYNSSNHLTAFVVHQQTKRLGSNNLKTDCLFSSQN
jgi:hypothetical protein